MFTDTTRLEKVCEQKLQAGVSLDDVIEYLHVQGVSILDAMYLAPSGRTLFISDVPDASPTASSHPQVCQG
jgi:hypothetical protein